MKLNLKKIITKQKAILQLVMQDEANHSSTYLN
jgi:hypothetical protein